MKLNKLLILALLFVVMSTSAFALTTYKNCTMSDDCGFGTGTLANGVLNFDTANTYSTDLDLNTWSWWNLTFQISWPANMSTNKYYLRETISGSSGGRWIQEYANPTYTFKPEGDYWPDLTGVTNTSWHTMSIVVNATSNISSLYIDGSSIIDEALTPSTGDYFRMSLNTFNNGGNVSIDNLTLTVLDSEVPPAAPVYNGTVNVILDGMSSAITVNKTGSFVFKVNVTCAGGLCGNVSVYLDPKETVNYPLSPLDYYSDGTTNQTIQDWIDDFAGYLWNDVVDSNFSTTGGLAAARWYQTESANNDSNLNSGGGDCSVLNSSNHQFCVVTDEHSNVQYIMSMSSNQTRYEMLHNFSKILFHPTPGYLPCWKAYVNGSKAYDSYDDLCKASDSASDADLRMAKAMRIACAKQEGGVWSINSVNYCADYYAHMKRVTQLDVVTTNGSYFLCNGYNNAQGSGCPQAFQSFRPDYYEISSFFDFAEYTNNDTYYDMGNDFLLWVNRSLGTNHLPRGKTGGFNGTTYECDENCAPEYIDNVDSIRFIHVLGEVCLQHRADISDWESTLCQNIWETFVAPYDFDTDALPYEMWSNSIDGVVKQNNSDYKAIGLWLPFAGYYDLDWTEGKVGWFFTNEWDEANSQPQGAGYMGAYYGSFMIRGLGTVTGLSDPLTHAGSKGGLVSTNTSATPFFTTSSQPYNCQSMNTTSGTCQVNWTVNATGNAGTYIFFAFTSATNGVKSGTSTNVSVTINVPVVAPNSASYVLKNKLITETLVINSTYCETDVLGACSNINDTNLSTYIMQGTTSQSYYDRAYAYINFTSPTNVSTYVNGTINVVIDYSEGANSMEYYDYSTSAWVDTNYWVTSTTDLGNGKALFPINFPIGAISQNQPIQFKIGLKNDTFNREVLYEINATINRAIYYSGEDLQVMCWANDSQNDRLEYNYTVYKDSTPLVSGYRGGSCTQDYVMTEPECKTHYETTGANTSFATGSGWYTITYAKPTYATSDSVWTVKHGTLPEYNISFATGQPKSCWDSNSTHLRLAFYSTITEFVGYKTGSSGVYCYNYAGQYTTSIGTFSGSTGKETTTGTCTNQMDDNSTSTGCVRLNGWSGGCYVPSSGWEGGCSGAMIYEEHMTWVQRYASGVNITLDTIDKVNFTRDNNITMSCSAYDGSTSSAFVNSTPADLTNADPTLNFSLFDDIGNAETNFTGLTGEVLDNLMLRLSSLYDLEGETLNVSIVVTNTTTNRTSQSFTGKNTGDSINASNFTLPTHAAWNYNITIKDPYLGATSYTGLFTAPNVAPNITDIDYYKNNFAAECRQDSQDCRLEFDITEDGCANVASAWIHFTALSGVHILNDTTLTLRSETEPNTCVFKSEDFMPTMSGTYTITAYYEDAAGQTSILVENMTVNPALNTTGGGGPAGGGGTDVVIINGREVIMSVSPISQTIRGVIGGTTLNEFRVVNDGKDSFKIDVYIDEEASSPGIKDWVTFGNTDVHEVLDLEVQTAGALNSPVQFIKYRIKVPSGTTEGDYQVVMKVIAEDEVEQTYTVTLKVSKGIGSLLAGIGETTIFDMREMLCAFAEDKEVCVANKDPIPFKTKHAFYSFASIGALSLFMMIGRRKRK